MNAKDECMPKGKNEIKETVLNPVVTFGLNLLAIAIDELTYHLNLQNRRVVLARQKQLFWEAPRSTPLRITQSNQQELAVLSEKVVENDVCVYWYFGRNGLKKEAIDFYREPVSSDLCKGAIPCLVDLTAWGSFIFGPAVLQKFNKNVERICTSPLLSFKTSTFFSELKEISESDTALFALLKRILKRPELWVASQGRGGSTLCLSAVMGEVFPLIEEIADVEAAKCYSVFQYIEFLFLVKAILQQKPDTQNIRFYLPNDENKYYFSSLTADLSCFLSSYGIRSKGLKIDIDCFNYGENVWERPYSGEKSPKVKKATRASVLNKQALQLLTESQNDLECAP
ncbi:MAG: hypothetical protein K0U37_00165 [Gammaproteobacteria bacterium]|nr:hypothetical protein [Gammaproteobacteria bacterium]